VDWGACVHHFIIRVSFAVGGFGDPAVAASQFNWLIMGEPLNRAMLLGDESIPKPAKLRRHAAAGVRVFLASYGK
jgi:TetR/AcrR family transcriptional repressor of mexJK operon